jgi:single-strand DNA-binding protein
MSGSVNKVILLGRLGADPEIRYTQTGTPVATLSLATNKTWKNKEGQKQEKTEWHRVILWSKLAELSGQYLTKGREVYIEGELQTRSWEKDGQKKYTTEVVGQTLQFIGSGASKGAGGSATEDLPPDLPPPPGENTSGTEDDIPF